MEQLIIKALLIIAFVLFTVVIMRSERSARTQAFRTLALLVFLAVAIIAVLFPSLINDLATSVGVGRGADLLLYAFIIVFIGNSLTTARKRRAQDEQITELARKVALQSPIEPGEARPQAPKASQG